MHTMGWNLSTKKVRTGVCNILLQCICLKMFFTTTSLAFKVLGSLAGHIYIYIKDYQ